MERVVGINHSHYVGGCVLNVSRDFKFAEDDGGIVYFGSPSDIRKVGKALRETGACPLFEKHAVMREGRKYRLCTNYYEPTYTISRVLPEAMRAWK